MAISHKFIKEYLLFSSNADAKNATFSLLCNYRECGVVHPSMHTQACILWHRDLKPTLHECGDLMPVQYMTGISCPANAWRGPQKNQFLATT